MAWRTPSRHSLNSLDMIALMVVSNYAIRPELGPVCGLCRHNCTKPWHQRTCQLQPSQAVLGLDLLISTCILVSPTELRVGLFPPRTLKSGTSDTAFLEIRGLRSSSYLSVWDVALATVPRFPAPTLVEAVAVRSGLLSPLSHGALVSPVALPSYRLVQS